MAMEIRKLPKWEESKIEDKLLILRQYKKSDSSLIVGLIFMMFVYQIIHMFPEPTLFDKISVVLLTILSVYLIVDGFVSSKIYTRRID